MKSGVVAVQRLFIDNTPFQSYALINTPYQRVSHSTPSIFHCQSHCLSMASPLPLPWNLQINDAHCHPTDTMELVSSIPGMKTSRMIIMATRFADQDLVADVYRRFPDKVVPGFGFHPWYSHLIWDDLHARTEACRDMPISKSDHYRAVLTPEPTDADIAQLPQPTPLSAVLEGLRQRLRDIPVAIVGEIGMDRGFRIPDPLQGIPARNTRFKRLSRYKVKMDQQKLIFKAQLRVAGEFARPVSVHAVACHGAVFDTFRDLWKGHEVPVEKNHDLRRRRRKVGLDQYEYLPDAVDSDSDADHSTHDGKTEEPIPLSGACFPPRICLHSFSGPVEQLRQYLKPATPGFRYPSDIFFSYSTTINTNPSRGHMIKVNCTLESVPDNAVLIESDLHRAGEQQDDALESATLLVAQVKNWPPAKTVECLNRNWERFVHGS
jgi:Tat protein secretion system quality control protein TatD with DNase activity